MGVGQQLQVSGRDQVRLEMRGLREDVGPAFCAGGGDRRRRGAGGLRRWRRERDGVLPFLPLPSPPLLSPPLPSPPLPSPPPSFRDTLVAPSPSFLPSEIGDSLAAAAAAACSDGSGARAQDPRGRVKALSRGRGWGQGAAPTTPRQWRCSGCWLQGCWHGPGLPASRCALPPAAAGRCRAGTPVDARAA